MGAFFCFESAAFGGRDLTGDRIMLKRLAIIVLIATAHLAACRLVIFMTMQLGMFASGDSPWFAAIGQVLVSLTRVLYFPVVSLALYSRQWFPGGWIYVPIIANSLLWAVVIYMVYVVWRKTVHEKS
jgi:hypothetical protein